MPQDYPASRHVLRDLRIEMDRRNAQGMVVRAPVEPWILGDHGAVRTGVLGVLTDVYGGHLSIEASRPDWAVTSQLELHVLRPCALGPLEVRGQALRAGRTSVVTEVSLRDGEGVTAALATMSFTRIQRRDAAPTLLGETAPLTTFALPDSGFRVPFLEAVGVRDVPGDPAAVELDLCPYVHNSVGALQGGLVTTLVEVAAEKLARAELGVDVVTTDFSVHFLSFCKAGPIRARAEILRRDRDTALLRVALRDVGQQDRLLSVASARTARP